jgi:hypothetical protein
MSEPDASIVEKLSLSLNDAALRGDLETAKVALGFGADVHFNFDRALRSASKNGHLEMVEFLVKSGADVHALNDEPLRAAAKSGRESVVAKLLELGANPDAQDGEALIESSKKGLSGIVNALLARRADPHFSDDQALRLAAYNGHADIVRALAANKADVFSMRGSAADLAAGEKHVPVVEFLAIEMNRQREMFIADLAQADAHDFLRRPWRETGEPAFIRAVKMNCMGQAVERMKECGDAVTSADLSGLCDRQQRSLGTVAAEYGRLGALFDVALWRNGTLEDAQTAWNGIPAAVRKNGGITDAEFEGVVAAFTQRQLKEKAGKVKLKF